MAGPGFDHDRGFQLEEGENRPETVMAHIGERAAAELIPAAEHSMGVVRMIRAVQRGPQPQLPVKTCRYWRCVRRESRVLGPYWPVRPVMDFSQGTNCAGVYPVLDLTDIGAVTRG